MWGVPFPHLDELDKVFGSDRAIGATSENFEEAVHGLQKETIELDKDEENDEEEEEGESAINSTNFKNFEEGKQRFNSKG